jgi:hypothetical protein
MSEFMRGLYCSRLAKSAEAYCFLYCDHFIDRPNLQCLVEHGLSHASNSCSLACSSPSQLRPIVLREDDRIRSCSSLIALFGPLVTIGCMDAHSGSVTTSCCLFLNLVSPESHELPASKILGQAIPVRRSLLIRFSVSSLTWLCAPCGVDMLGGMTFQSCWCFPA